jgi:hypothetical protein
MPLTQSARCGAALVLVAVVTSGCTPDPDPAPPVATPAAVPSPSAAPESAYSAVGVDLCAKADRAPLESLKLTVKGTAAKSPTSAPGAACLFELRTADGHEASLLVEASTPPSAEQAEQLYRATAAVTGMTAAGDVAGLGDEAAALTKRSDPGQSEYLIHSRAGNLVVKVWLSVGGDAYPPEQTLAGPVRTITDTTIKLIPEV